jgi:hypothetical protein
MMKIIRLKDFEFNMKVFGRLMSLETALGALSDTLPFMTITCALLAIYKALAASHYKTAPGVLTAVGLAFTFRFLIYIRPWVNQKSRRARYRARIYQALHQANVNFAPIYAAYKEALTERKLR